MAYEQLRNHVEEIKVQTGLIQQLRNWLYDVTPAYWLASLNKRHMGGERIPWLHFSSLNISDSRDKYSRNMGNMHSQRQYGTRKVLPENL